MLRIIRNGMEPILVLLVVVVLRRFGLSGTAPLGVVATMLLFGVVCQQPAVQLFLSGGDVRKRLGIRIGLHLLNTTVTMYLTGWGAVLAIAHLSILSMHLKRSGSRAWRPAAVASAGSIALGQLAVGFGWMHSNLPVRETHGIAVLIALGTVATARTLGRAVAAREAAEAALRTNEERLKALLRDGTEVIMELDPDGSVSYVSPASLAVMGYPPHALTGHGLDALIHPDDAVAALEMRSELLGTDGSVEHTLEIRVRHADGQWHWHEVTARNMLSHPDVRAIIRHHRDVTQRREAQDRIAYAAAHDGLTGLANAPTLSRDLERALAQGTRYQHPVGMLFLDLDGFKQVNDTYGHDIGDLLLSHVAGVIRGTVRDTDSVGRLGGDEFGVVLTRLHGAEEALIVASRIIRGIEENASVAGLKLDVGCSIGVALASPGGSDVKSLMRHADAAMYRSKRRGRNGAQLYIEEDTSAPWRI
jgi:diguanylate cyclase (GGDEF)-like protein/PAS domain S-box-containing protein